MGRRPKTATIIDTKTRILEEASRIFADKGFDATGIDEIAKKAGITKSVIYYHFTNKAAILQTLLDGYYKEAMEIKTAIGKAYFENGKSDFTEYLVQARKFFDESHTRILKILLMESLKNKDDFPLFELIRRVVGDTVEVFKDNITEEFKDNWQKKFAGFFFMSSFPLIGYLVLEEKYCKFTGMKRQELEENVFAEFTRYFEKSVKELMFGP